MKNNTKRIYTISEIKSLADSYAIDKEGYFYELVLLPYLNAILKEVEAKSGQMNKHDGEYQRWSSNPGSLEINGEKLRFRVPRIRNKVSGEVETPESYKKSKKKLKITKEMVGKILNGISQKRYKEVATQLTDGFGLSQSRVSELFHQEAEKALKELETRDLSQYKFLAVIIDGKYFRKEQIVYAIGITNTGFKKILGFIFTNTENAEAIKGLLKNILDRGFKYEEGILFVVDGSKGIIKAIKDVFGKFGLIQRCQYHKRENVVSYLPEEYKVQFRGKLQRAYLEPDYETAKSRLMAIYQELKLLNHTAANSLLEGLEETLTIHKLGIREELGRSFSTTNIIESANSRLSDQMRNVKRWYNSSKMANWVKNLLHVY